MGHKVDDLQSQPRFVVVFDFHQICVEASFESKTIYVSFSFTRMQATRIIENTWCSYRDRQMFKLLKFAICAAVSIKHIQVQF